MKNQNYYDTLRFQPSINLALNYLKITHHPGSLNDALTHVEILLKTVFEALTQYRNLKTQGGLIDFNDMVQLANQILSNKAWLKEVKEQYDCVIIDEFQDTNPLQFAMLWALHQSGIPSLIVGDIKPGKHS